jgi:hypothetical protein
MRGGYRHPYPGCVVGLRDICPAAGVARFHFSGNRVNRDLSGRLPSKSYDIQLGQFP